MVSAATNQSGAIGYPARVPNVFERAPSGRAKCRGCAQPIAKDDLRFGERLPNPFADEGEMTLWFHPLCAAYKRPEALLPALADAPQELSGDRARLEQAARHSLAHRRLPRISGAERAPTGQARCRQCHEPIERGHWRIRLTLYQEGRFEPGGFVHLSCGAAYFETADILDAVLHFSAGLSGEERQDLQRAATSNGGGAASGKL